MIISSFEILTEKEINARVDVLSQGPDGHSQLTVKEEQHWDHDGQLLASRESMEGVQDQDTARTVFTGCLQSQQKIAHIVLGNIIWAVTGLSKWYVTDIDIGQGGYASQRAKKFQLFLEPSTVHRETLSKGEVCDLVSTENYAFCLTE